MNKSIPVSDIVNLIEGLLKFPYPQVCRHLVVCDLLSLFEKHGINVSEDLARAVVQCDDEVALRRLKDEHQLQSDI